MGLHRCAGHFEKMVLVLRGLTIPIRFWEDFLLNVCNWLIRNKLDQ